MAGSCCSVKKRLLFLKKKKQKDFSPFALPGVTEQTDKKFFGFFQKRTFLLF
jgi:hypothetical protein